MSGGIQLEPLIVPASSAGTPAMLTPPADISAALLPIPIPATPAGSAPPVSITVAPATATATAGAVTTVTTLTVTTTRTEQLPLQPNSAAATNDPAPLSPNSAAIIEALNAPSDDAGPALTVFGRPSIERKPDATPAPTGYDQLTCRMWGLVFGMVAVGIVLTAVGANCLANGQHFDPETRGFGPHSQDEGYTEGRCGRYGSAGGFAMLNCGFFIFVQALLLIQFMAGGGPRWAILASLLALYIPLFGGVNPLILFYRFETGLSFEEAYYQVIMYPLIVTFVAVLAAFNRTNRDVTASIGTGAIHARRLSAGLGAVMRKEASEMTAALGADVTIPLPHIGEIKDAGRKHAIMSHASSVASASLYAATKAADSENDALPLGLCCRDDEPSEYNRAGDPIYCACPWFACKCCQFCHERMCDLFRCGSVLKLRESHVLYVVFFLFSALLILNPWTICFVRLYENEPGPYGDHNRCFGAETQGSYFILITNFLLGCLLSAVARYPAIQLIGIAQTVRRRVCALKLPEAPKPDEILLLPPSWVAAPAKHAASEEKKSLLQAPATPPSPSEDDTTPLPVPNGPSPSRVVERFSNGLRQLNADQRKQFDAISWPLNILMFLVIASSTLCAISNLVSDFRTRDTGPWLQYLLFTIALNALVYTMLYAASVVEDQLSSCVGGLDDYVSRISAVQGSRHAEVAYCRSVADYWRRQSFGMSWCGIAFSVNTYRGYVGGLVSPLVTIFARQIYDWAVSLPYFASAQAQVLGG